MRRFWHIISLFLITITVSCGGSTIPYWIYTEHQATEHIIHPDHIPVWIDQSFNSTQVEEIRAAIAEWNYVMNGHLIIQLVERQALGIDKKMHTYPDSFTNYAAGKILQQQCEKTNLGWVIYNLPSDDKNLDQDTDPETLAFVRGIDTHAIVVVSDRFGGRSIKDVMMHEMAHLLGAIHVNTPSLEYPYYGQFQYSCIDKITVAQVAQQHRIPLKQLNYCRTPNFI